MERPLIAMSSITYAMKAKDILFNHGISCSIERTQKAKGDKGCGYSLYVPKNIDKAKQILLENGIKILDSGGDSG